MRTVPALVVLAACHATASPPAAPVANVARTTTRNPCDMIQAMLAIEDPSFQKYYARADDARTDALIVQVQGSASVVPPDLTCPDRSFTLYRGERNVDWMIPRFIVSASATQTWNFMVSRVQPNPRVNPDGSFDVATSYTHAIGGFVEWTGSSWRTFVDVDRAIEESRKAR